LEHRSDQRSKNRLAALQPDDEDEEWIQEVRGSPPGLTLGDFWHKVEPKKKHNKKVARNPLYSLELNTVGQDEGTDDLWITIDSGASENVISEKMAPQVKVQPSQGSREGVRYVTANGETMANKGEKHIQVKTSEGHKCMLNMQVTDVKKPLMSVARICDAGHEVVFRSNGGTITHTGTGQTTKFQRIDNVYRLKVGIVSEPVFRRPGK
jgi:hypothetical protein